MIRFNLLEVSRAIAAILVVLHHATLDAPFFYNSEPFRNFFYFGMAGVDYFFVLSGFIIYYIHSNDTFSMHNIKRYFLKRVIRIYPLFLIITTGLFLIYLLIPNLSVRENLSDIGVIIKSFLLLPQINPPILSVSWTLVYEMFFYFTFILIIINKKMGILIYILWSITIIGIQYFVKDILFFPFSFYFNPHNIEFVFGILLGLILKDSDLLSYFKNDKLLIFIGIILFILNGINQNYILFELNSFITLIIYGISSFLIILGLIILEKNNEIKVPKLLILLGSASYSIYLVHVPVLSILHRVVQKLNLKELLQNELIFILVSAIAIISGIILHILIEKPIIKFLNTKFIKKVK